MTELKNMAYWRAKNMLPGIDQGSEGNTDTPDGKSGSSPLQSDLPKVNVTAKNKVNVTAKKKKEKVITTINTKDNTITKTKGDKSAVYHEDLTYQKKHGGTGRKFTTERGGSFIISGKKST